MNLLELGFRKTYSNSYGPSSSFHQALKLGPQTAADVNYRIFGPTYTQARKVIWAVAREVSHGAR